MQFEIWKPLSIADSSVVVIESLSELRAPCIIVKNRELSCLRDFWMDRNWVLISVLLVWRVQSCVKICLILISKSLVDSFSMSGRSCCSEFRV